MNNFILTLKHWQLFIIVIIIPFIIQSIIIIFSLIFENELIIDFLPLISFPFFSIFFVWFYYVGLNLYVKIPSQEQMNFKTFKVFLLIISISFFLNTIFTVYSSLIFRMERKIDFSLFYFIIPIQVSSMYSFFYCSYFISKTLKSVEYQKSVTFNDYVREFFMILFFPIGLWFIQPRINKVFENNSF